MCGLRHRLQGGTDIKEEEEEIQEEEEEKRKFKEKEEESYAGWTLHKQCIDSSNTFPGGLTSKKKQKKKKRRKKKRKTSFGQPTSLIAQGRLSAQSFACQSGSYTFLTNPTCVMRSSSVTSQQPGQHHGLGPPARYRYML